VTDLARRSVRTAIFAICIARTSFGEPLATPEVVVRAPPLVAPPRDPSVAGSVISEDRLKAPGLQASDVLREEPGVAVAQTGGYGELSTATIRGATAAQTPVYLGGVRLNDDVGGTADLSTVPLWLLQRVEIYRSNAPLDADELGIGGAIFFEPRIPRRTEAGVGAMAGSFGAGSLWGFAGFGGEGGAGLLGVHYEGARNDYSFTDDRGTRFDTSDDRRIPRTNADAHTLDAWGIGRVRLGRGHTDLLVNDTEREQGVPGLTLFPSTRARASFARRLGAITSVQPCGESDRCEITASSAVITTSSHFDDPLREIALTARSAELDAVRVDESVRMRLRPTDSLTVSPGIRAATESLMADLDSAPSLRAQRFTARLSTSVDWALGDLVTLHGMGAIECNGTSAGGHTPWSFPDDMNDVSRASLCSSVDPAARTGIEIGSRNLELISNVGRYVRVPTLAELYGISGAVRGNSVLLPETGLTADAGFRAARAADGSFLGGANLDFFGFVRDANHLVAYQRSSLGYVRPFNVGSARVAGLELLGTLRPLPFALLALSATLLDPRDTSSNRPVNDVLPYESRLTVVPRIELTARPSGFVERMKLSLAYLYESNRYADRAGLIVIPSQGSLDIDVEAAALRERLAVRGRLANALDQRRMDLIGYPLPGRAAYVALEAKW
jgi:iron complex outermembrane receptor protein